MRDDAHAGTEGRPGLSGTASQHGSAELLSALFDHGVPVRHVPPGGTVLLHGSRASMMYEVVSGTVRCCTISREGRRQIFRFARSGDLLGFADLDTWHFTAEAVDHVILRAVPADRVEAALRESPALQRALRELMANELAAREHQLVALAFMPAEERLLHFLKDFAARRKSSGFVVLPMTRQDIGDHLGLTLETVSRTFGALKRREMIEMQGADRFRIIAPAMPRAAAAA